MLNHQDKKSHFQGHPNKKRPWLWKSPLPAVPVTALAVPVWADAKIAQRKGRRKENYNITQFQLQKASLIVEHFPLSLKSDIIPLRRRRKKIHIIYQKWSVVIIVIHATTCSFHCAGKQDWTVSVKGLNTSSTDKKSLSTSTAVLTKNRAFVPSCLAYKTS